VDPRGKLILGDGFVAFSKAGNKHEHQKQRAKPEDSCCYWGWLTLINRHSGTSFDLFEHF